MFGLILNIGGRSDDINQRLIKKDCQINIRGLPQRKPLLRDPTSKTIILPDAAGSSVITLKTGNRIEIDCPGANILLDSLSLGEITDAVCISGTIFNIQNKRVEFGSVVCSRRITSIARYTGDKCFEKGKEIEVGFQFSDGEFVKQMTTCFDENTREVYYSLFELSHQIGDQNTGGTRPSWTEGNFYNLGARLNNLYPNAAQRSTINQQLGLSDDDVKYIKPTGNYYLARGHLTARSDYIYYPQQEATFHYINSVPQWQTFNGFNWFYLERNLRQYAANKGLDLIVMTGGYGISTLPHESTGKPVPLHLYVDDNGNKAIPIPELFWKVAYSPSTKAGIAVLGLNNPYQGNVSGSVICDDIADKLNWWTFERTRTQAGYMYACTISSLRKRIPQIPNYRAKKILN
uniref:DNA/RNA non-specific nuclease 1 n=1 Tax=Cylas puncticollis TaxID=1550038 RepID=A0A4D6Q3Y1_9CUCU|nr:DNA/RNA non-specific nuclease 1 [Cylas puncticollis]